ncbi:ATP-binding cassette domain-containing protein [Asanoa sp. NPDC050611]|uniref:ATP-binding cassette domain-containing protein n=1 Tax=Asanoa sp. NPDC050611 TaxID=3157098 RepID=UPI0033F3E396
MPEGAAAPSRRGAALTQVGEALRYSPLLVFTILAVVVFAAMRPGFLSVGGFLDIGQQVAVVAIVAFAMTAVIVARGIDISVGSTLAVSGVIGAQLVDRGVPAVLAIVVTILVGATVGLLNGVLIGYFGISPLMATLGTMALGRGAAVAWSDASSIPVTDIVMLYPGGSYVGLVPTSVIIAVVCMAGWWWLLRGTVYGRWIYAVGGNADAARAALVPTRLVQLSTYVLAGAFAGLGAVITLGRLGSAQPLAGNGLEFAAITAAIVGGTALSGGKGTIAGTAMGALLVGVISAGLSFVQAPQETIYVVTGVLILLAVLVAQRDELADLLARLRRGWTAGAARAAPVTRELTLDGVGKSFPGVRALDGVSFSVRAGEVVALAGENGAGKSTLVKVLAGGLEPDQGRVLLDGRPVRLRSNNDSQAAGISVIHQHLSLVPDLTVAENLFLGREPRAFGLLRRGTMRREARRVLDELGLRLDVDAPAAGLTVAERQMVEVAKAMLGEAWLVVMDEPTSALSNQEREHLYALVQRLSGRGVAVLYISHRMEELFTLADRAVVLRDGALVSQERMADLDPDRLITLMVGRQIQNVFPHVPVEPGEVVLDVAGLADGGLLVDATLRVHAGEVVGLAGLVGSGRSELLRCVAGLARPTAGSIRIVGAESSAGSPNAARRLGVAYVPEDRHHEGTVPLMSVHDNLVLAWIRGRTRLGLLRRGRTAALAAKWIERLAVRPPLPGRAVRLLSGGNQQKVVLARWLATEPRLLLLDEPTRGIDVGAKAEIHALIAELKQQGLAVVLVSSELPELLGVADRVVVLHEGRTTGELPRGASEEQVGDLAFGHARATTVEGGVDR